MQMYVNYTHTHTHIQREREKQRERDRRTDKQIAIKEGQLEYQYKNISTSVRYYTNFAYTPNLQLVIYFPTLYSKEM